MHELGLGVKKNYQKAIEYFIKATCDNSKAKDYEIDEESEESKQHENLIQNAGIELNPCETSQRFIGNSNQNDSLSNVPNITESIHQLPVDMKNKYHTFDSRAQSHVDVNDIEIGPRDQLVTFKSDNKDNLSQVLPIQNPNTSRKQLVKRDKSEKDKNKHTSKAKGQKNRKIVLKA